MSRRSIAFIDVAAVVSLVTLNLLVIAPFLRTDFSPATWNNEYLYIGISRMFRDLPWSWNPLRYGGAPFHYLYPPLFHELVATVPVRSLGRAYHLVSAGAYALVPAAFYIAALQLFCSRSLAASLAALESFSPTVLYVLVPTLNGFAANYCHGPWGFVALIASNESGHTLALAFILLALAAVWRQRWLIASVCTALVLLTNWAGVIGLLMVLAAAAIALSRKFGWPISLMRFAGVLGTGYGLAAFWITPNYLYSIRLQDWAILRYLQFHSPWNPITRTVLLISVLLLGVSVWHRIQPALAFVLALLAISGGVVIAYTAGGSYLLPLPHRYVQEFNIALILAIGIFARLARKLHWALGALVLIASAYPALPLMKGGWKVQSRSIDPHASLAFHISDWLAQHAGSSRVFVAGELEGSLNIWTNVPQVAGSGQGIQNYALPAAYRQIALGCGSRERARTIAELWLRAIAVRYLVVHGSSSTEHFHWFVQPDRFASFPVAWTNHVGDTIYELPPPEEQPAVVVDLNELPRLPRLRSTDDARSLTAYVAWARGKRPARITWVSPNHAEIDAGLQRNEGILIKTNYSSGWVSSTGTVVPDPIGFLLIAGTGDAHMLNLRFRAPWGHWVGRATTAGSIALLLIRVPFSIIGAAAILPAAVSYGILRLHFPAGAVLAEQTFRQVQPPLISPGGIVNGIGMTQPPLDRGGVVALFGSGFGSPPDVVRVWVGDGSADVLYRSPNQLNLRMPADTPGDVKLTVEVNGCRGNSFSVATR